MARDDRPTETLDPRRLRASLSSSLGLGADGRRSRLVRTLSPRPGEDHTAFDGPVRVDTVIDEPRREDASEVAQSRSRPSFTWEMPPSPDVHPPAYTAPPVAPIDTGGAEPYPDDDGFGRPADVVAEREAEAAPSPRWNDVDLEPPTSNRVAEPPPPPSIAEPLGSPVPTPQAPPAVSRTSGAARLVRDGEAADARAGRSAPIVPPQSVAGRSLVAVVAIMGFLACLAVGVLSLVMSAAHDWQIDVAREVTVQIKPGDPAGLPARLSRTLDIARATPGVRSARLVDEREGAALLEPWLGQGLDLSSLPIPRLVVLELDDPATADLSGLRRRLTTEVTGALLDDHAVWTSRLRTMAGAVVVSGVSVVLLVLFAMSLTVVFATRSAMAGNRDVIEVLHFVGAEDVYVAEQFQRHFLRLGLIGGGIGGATAVVAFQLLRLLTRPAPGDAVADQAQALFGGFSVGFLGHLGVLVVMGLVAGLTAATSRFTVLDHLKRLD